MTKFNDPDMDTMLVRINRLLSSHPNFLNYTFKFLRLRTLNRFTIKIDDNKHIIVASNYDKNNERVIIISFMIIENGLASFYEDIFTVPSDLGSNKIHILFNKEGIPFTEQDAPIEFMELLYDYEFIE